MVMAARGTQPCSCELRSKRTGLRRASWCWVTSQTRSPECCHLQMRFASIVFGPFLTRSWSSIHLWFVCSSSSSMASPDLSLPLPGSGKLLTPDGIFRKNLKGPRPGLAARYHHCERSCSLYLFQLHIFMHLWRRRPCDAMKGYHKRPRR